ncbi:MAG: flagellar biosynthetic protein FliQ [Terriglobales bacterium]|jgi:flagellar biosynthetic protein FliQ
METAQTIALVRGTLEIAFFLAVPLLAIATAVSLLVNVGQVLTSLQDQTLSTVPRLTAVAGSALLLLPWMLRKLIVFTLATWGDFHALLR